MVQKVNDSHKDLAYLIRSVAYGDDHRILSFLTSQGTKVDVIALGARKSIKRFSGVLDFLHCLQIEYRQTPRGGLAQLVDCSLTISGEAILRDYTSTTTALHWLGLISRVLHEGQSIPAVFTLLQESLQGLFKSGPSATNLRFLERLLSLLGFHLNLEQCLRCDSDSTEIYYFDIEQGALLCEDCCERPMSLKLSKALSSHRLQETGAILKSCYQAYLGVEVERVECN